MGEILVGPHICLRIPLFVQPILACAIVAVIANVSMIVSSFFTFSPFLTGLGPVDDVAYPPVVTRSYFSLISDPYSLRSACSGLRPVTPCAFNQSSTRSKIGSHR